MHSKLVGGILLIVGTSVGAGMLGLPIAAAKLGFIGSVILLVASWLAILTTAFLILEVNLWLPSNSNIISMAGATIGPIGQIIAWGTYLLLLYSLLCAYIAAGSDLFHNLFIGFHWNIPMWLTAVLFTVIFGSIVYLGIHSVDRANRLLISLKFGAFFILVFLLVPFITIDKLSMGNLAYLTTSSVIMVTITSFSWTTLIPSLRAYFAGDVKKLRWAIVIGSTLPLICYVIWDAVIMGVIPLEGKNGLVSVLHANNSTSYLVKILSEAAGNATITFFIKLFTSVCVLTSFLGVALCLSDFFADGLRLEKKGLGNFTIYGLTFIPSVCIAIFIPNLFIKALEYAGIYCTTLLILLPAWMAWRGRLHRKIAAGKKNFILWILMLGSTVLIVRSFLQA